MTKEQCNYLVQQLRAKCIHFAHGLTDNEVSQVEAKFNIKFPPDLTLFLQTALPISKGFVNWRLGLKSTTEKDKIIERLDWPLTGMLFDLRESDFWNTSWGDKPSSYAEKESIAKQKYATYPKLIPIFSHRYIPSRPNKAGNPIFSVYQMDIIFYGYDLSSYFANEFSFKLSDKFAVPNKPNREIEFWSEWVHEQS